MSRYSDIATSAAFRELTRLTRAEVERIRAAWPFLPDDYLAFLEEIGWGSVNDGSFMVYSKPIDPAFVYGEDRSQHTGLILVGDDFQGYNVGFVRGRTGVIEVEPNNDEHTEVAESFEGFVRSRLACTKE